MKLYAFWRYDQFPYVLGGEVETVLDDGRVKVVGFMGMVFRPIKLVPKKAGVKLHEQIKAIEVSHRVAALDFQLQWTQKVLDVLPEAKDPTMQFMNKLKGGAST